MKLEMVFLVAGEASENSGVLQLAYDSASVGGDEFVLVFQNCERDGRNSQEEEDSIVIQADLISSTWYKKKGTNRDYFESLNRVFEVYEMVDGGLRRFRYVNEAS
ncbi:hypothetical protein LXL04_003881 [Taraxacum kok-saghyz]